MIVAVRSFAMAVKQEKAASEQQSVDKRKVKKRLKWPSSYTLIFDTETTIDHRQNLRIASYQIRNGGDLIEKGLFYQPASLTRNDLRVMQRYAAENRLVLRNLNAFLREIFYRYGYYLGGLIVGFNLPFDLSRLAYEIDTSHGHDMRGGFTLDLLPEKWMPNVLCGTSTAGPHSSVSQPPPKRWMGARCGGNSRRRPRRGTSWMSKRWHRP